MITKGLMNVIKNYYHARDHNNDYSKWNLGFGFIHYALIRNIRPKNVLVIGSQRGYVPAICALACKDENQGRVDFVDAGYELNDKKSWGGIGIWKDADSSYFSKLGVEDWISVYCMTTEDFHQNLPESKYQYIYIDGDHSYEGVAKDYDLLYNHLDDGGFMVFHDVLVDKETQWGKCGVKKFWDEMVKDNQEGSDCLITIPFSAGLGIIRK